MAKICDNLPHIDFLSLNGFAADAAWPEAAVLLVFKEMVSHTTKPIGFSCTTEDVFDEVIDMASLVAGGADQLREKPFLYHYAEPTTPLVHSTPSLRRLLKSVDSGIPLVYTPMPMAGATAPCSLAGTLLLANAETLTGIVIAQLLRPGAPYIYGGIPGIMDMQTMIFAYGAPEMHLMVAAMTDLAHHYDLPMFGTAGCTDAKSVDQQAAIEAALSCNIAFSSGADLVHDVGLIDHAEMVSTEMIVLCDEIIGMIKHTGGKIEVSDKTLLGDLIHRVGPGGNYLTDDHTLDNFRTAWFPSLMNRNRGGKYLQGDINPTSFSKCLNQKTRDILDRHEPQPLPVEVQAELSRRAAKW